MSIHEFILVELDKGVEKIKLNRPKQLNALTYPLIVEIIEVLEQSMKNKSIRVITIEGAGNNFCSGDDLKSMG
ncbi:MAG: enoyl-CoA hydratase/isomerase family protein, partial [Promethearchaeota archaeon]